MAEWVALRPILEVCNKETGYTGGGRLQEPWWRKTVARKQLSTTLKDTLEATRERSWKSGRRVEDRGGSEVLELESNAWIDGPQYDGMETGDAQVGK